MDFYNVKNNVGKKMTTAVKNSKSNSKTRHAVGLFLYYITKKYLSSQIFFEKEISKERKRKIREENGNWKLQSQEIFCIFQSGFEIRF